MRPNRRGTDAAPEGCGRQVNGINLIIYVAGIGVFAFAFWLGWKAGMFFGTREGRRAIEQFLKKEAK